MHMDTAMRIIIHTVIDISTLTTITTDMVMNTIQMDNTKPCRLNILQSLFFPGESYLIYFFRQKLLLA